jgi:phosphate transport system substrate-binding protein
MKSKLIVLIALAVSSLLAAISCGPAAEETAEAVKLQGAGATFPEPVYNQWMFEYEKVSTTKINYEGIGSGGGQKAIIGKTVDFAGSDAPMSAEDLDTNGLLQFPMIVGGIVPVINIPGIENNQLKLKADVLGRIFSGDITTWNHPDILADNPELATKLPAQKIVIVHRSDGSGTTWTFTYFLHKASPYWREHMRGVDVDKETGAITKEFDISYGKSIKWPADAIGQKGNPGVANQVQQSPYSIGYVEYAYALESNLVTVQLQNAAGAFVTPSLDTFAEAAAQTDWSKAGDELVPVAQGGAKTWPIVGVSFILIHFQQNDANKAKAMLKYFDWCFTNGGAAAEKLHYVSIPKSVADSVREEWAKITTADGQPINWK